MSSFYTDMSNDIINSDGYRCAIDILFDEYVKKTISVPHSLDREIARKLTTAIQYFYQSEEALHKKEGAEVLSMLLHVAAETTQEIVNLPQLVPSVSRDILRCDLSPFLVSV